MWDSLYSDPQCIVMSPYLHSIYIPYPEVKSTPWDLKAPRKILMVYFGSTKQGRLNTLLQLYKEKRRFYHHRDYYVAGGAKGRNIHYLFYSPDEKTRNNEDVTRWASSGHMSDRSKSSFLKEVQICHLFPQL